MYIVFKILHIAAVVIFLGNLVTGIFWKMHAEKSGDPRIVRHTMAGLVPDGQGDQRELQFLGSPDSNPRLKAADLWAADPCVNESTLT